MFNFPSGKFPKVRLGTLWCRRADRCCLDVLGGRASRPEQTEDRALRLGQTWKLPLEKLHIWEVATREKSVGKVTDI